MACKWPNSDQSSAELFTCFTKGTVLNPRKTTLPCVNTASFPSVVGDVLATFSKEFKQSPTESTHCSPNLSTLSFSSLLDPPPKKNKK